MLSLQPRRTVMSPNGNDDKMRASEPNDENKDSDQTKTDSSSDGAAQAESSGGGSDQVPPGA